MSAQVPLFPDEIERVDVIAIERDGLDIFAFDSLAVAAGTGWQELRFRLKESPPTVVLVEDRVALMMTSRRAIEFVSRGEWIV